MGEKKSKLLFEKFEPGLEEFDSYMNRFSCFIEYAGNVRKYLTKYFIACVGAETYSQLKKLYVPKKPIDLDFKKVTELIRGFLYHRILVDTELH